MGDAAGIAGGDGVHFQVVPEGAKIKCGLKQRSLM
jgi:hypothetical protein